MWDIPRLYTSACSYAVQPVRIYPILMSILLHHFKVLTECTKEIEQIEAKVKNNPMNKKAEELTVMQEELQGKGEQEEKMPTTLDGFFVKNE